MASGKEELPRTHDIEYLYLEFDTPLPTPRITSPPGRGQSPPPECPNLEKYTSPFQWPKWRKSMMTWVSCAVTAVAGYAAGESSPAADELSKEWDISIVVYNLSITIFCIGFALAPMILAPFSEINGRKPIFIASGIVFVGMENHVWSSECQFLMSNSVYRSMRRNPFLCGASHRTSFPRSRCLYVFTP